MIRFAFVLSILLSFAQPSHAGITSACLKALQSTFVPSHGLAPARAELAEMIREFDGPNASLFALDLLTDDVQAREDAMRNVAQRQHITQWEMLALGLLANHYDDSQALAYVVRKQPSMDITPLFWAQIRMALEGDEASQINAITLIVSHGKLRSLVPPDISQMISQIDVKPTAILEKEYRKSATFALERQLELSRVRDSFFGQVSHRYL